MKKILMITLVDDRKLKRDLSLEKGMPLGAPANDQTYAQLCMAIAANGCTDTERTNAKQYTHIAPSQIKNVQIIFEEDEK